MPAASWRTSPARTMSLWLMASASAGASRRVGVRERIQRISSGRRLDLVGSGHAGIVDQPLHGPAPQDVRLQDLLEIGLLDASVPDIVPIHHHHGAVATLREAPRLVDAHLGMLARLRGRRAQDFDVLLDITLLRAGLARR